MASALEVASLIGVIALDDRASATLRNVDTGLAGLGDRLGNLGSRLQGAGASLGAVFAPAAAAIGAGINVASDFESVMAEIGARTGLAGESLDQLRDVALQMGADTAFSGQQAAEAMLQLLTSGQDVEQTLQTLPSVLDAAAASGEDLGRTADTVTDIMAAFRLPATRSRQVVDALARAAGASSADMAGLGEAFANVGGTANSLGLSVDETAAIFAVFSENGIKGAEAGTQLRSMLNAMTRDTADAAEAWTAAGVSLTDARGNIRPLEAVIDDLAISLDDMTEIDRIRTIQGLAGSFGQLGLQALLSSGGFDTMQAAMGNAVGATEVAEARMDTFSGRLDSLRGSVETLAIQALTPFMDNVLKPMIEDLTGVFNGITDWAEANPDLTTSLVGVVLGGAVLSGALVILGAIINAVATVVGALTTGFGLLRGALTLMTTIGLIPILGPLALGAGLAFAYANNVLGFRDAVDKLKEALKQVYQPLLDFLSSFEAGRDALLMLDPMGEMARRYQRGEITAGGVRSGGTGGGSIGNPPLVNPFPRAMGGGVNAGQPYLVGENGPEIFAPGRSGHIIPNAGGTTIINVQMPAAALASPSLAAARGREFGEAIMQTVRSRG